MPKVAQYQPDQVQSQVVSQPLSRAQSRDFAAPVVKGIQDVVQAGFQIKKRIDTTSAEEALVQFERDKNDVFYNPKTGYFNTQGKNAYDNSIAANKSIENLKTQYGENLSAEAKLMFNGAADKHITRAQVDIQRHSAKGLQAWEISTIESGVENSIENASLYWNDAERLKVQNVLGRQAILDSSEMLGLSPEATAEKLQTYNSAFSRASIEAATQSSAAEGKQALSDYGDELEGPDKIKMQGLIDKKESVEKTKDDATSAVLTANKLIDQHDDRKDIIEEVNKIEDVELRKKTMTESMNQFSRKRQAEAEAQADVYENAEDYIIKDGSAETFKMNNPDDWELLSEKQKKVIEKGKPVATNWNVFSDLMLLPKDKLAKINPTDYFDMLGKAQRSSLIGAVKTAGGKSSSREKIDSQTGRSRTAQTTSAVEQLFGKKSKWNDEKREKVNGFYSLLDGEEQSRKNQLDRELTSEEFTDLLSGFTRKTVQEGFFFDSEIDLGDIPAADVQELSKFLRGKGIPVTADNLIKAHKQASK